MSYKAVITDWLDGKQIQNHEEKLEGAIIRIKYKTYKNHTFSSSITVHFAFDALKWNRTKKITQYIRFRVKSTEIDPILKFKWFYLSVINIDKKHQFIDEFLELLKDRPFRCQDQYHNNRYRKYDCNGYVTSIHMIDKIKPSHLLVDQWNYDSNRLTQNCKSIVIQTSFYSWNCMNRTPPINKHIIWFDTTSQIYPHILLYLPQNNNYTIYIKSSYTFVQASYFDTDKYELIFKEFALNRNVQNLYYIPQEREPINLTSRINKYREDVKLSQVLMQPNNPLIHHKLSFPGLLDYIYKFLEDKK